MDRAVAFYRDSLGLDVVEHDGDWSEVNDIDSSVDELKGNGVECADGVSEHPWGKIAPFKDADGNDLQLYAPPAD